MEKCHDTVGALKDTLVLTLELADDVLQDSPELIQKILQSAEIQNAIKKTLEEEGKRLAEKQRLGEAVTKQDSTKLLSSLKDGAASAAGVVARKQIEGSQEFKDVKASLEKLACSFRNSPMGVYIDENKKLLIFVATGLAIGGVASMYVLKTGDWAAAQLSRLANQMVQFKPLGNVSVGAKGIKFVPSNRTVEATVFAKVDWSAVKFNFELKVGFQEDELKHVSGQAGVVVPLRPQLNLIGNAAIGRTTLDTGVMANNYNLGLGLKYSTKTVDAGLSVDILGVTKDGVDAFRRDPELKVNLGVTIRFD